MNSVGELFVCRYVWQVASVSCTRGLTWPARPLSFSLVVVSSIEASIQTSHVHVRSALYLFHQWAEMDTECMQDPFPGRRSARPRNAQWQNPGEEGREGGQLAHSMAVRSAELHKKRNLPFWRFCKSLQHQRPRRDRGRTFTQYA